MTHTPDPLPPGYRCAIAAANATRDITQYTLSIHRLNLLNQLNWANEYGPLDPDHKKDLNKEIERINDLLDLHGGPTH